MVAIKQRPPPLRINKLSHEISKPRRPPPAPVTAQQRLPIVIYTYSPKVIQTEPNNFMMLVQRLTGSTPTRQRCTELASTSFASDLTKEIRPNMTSADCHGLEMSRAWRSEVEDESNIPSLEDTSLQESSTAESGPRKDLTGQRLSCVSSENWQNLELELMTPVQTRNRHVDKHSSVHEIRHPHNAAEDHFLAHLPLLTPSTNCFLRDFPFLFPETFESFGNILSPYAIASPHGGCISPWVPSPGSVACKEMAFALLGDNGA